MPVMDGYEATIKIKEVFLSLYPQGISRNGDKLHVVAVTAFVNEENIAKCYEVSMSDVIHKPLSNEHLKSVIEKFYYKLSND